jgi:hypothetical protein
MKACRFMWNSTIWSMPACWAFSTPSKNSMRKRRSSSKPMPSTASKARFSTAFAKPIGPRATCAAARRKSMPSLASLPRRRAVRRPRPKSPPSSASPLSAGAVWLSNCAISVWSPPRHVKSSTAPWKESYLPIPTFSRIAFANSASCDSPSTAPWGSCPSVTSAWFSSTTPDSLR